MSVKLIAFDLDGTLLDDDKNLPEENLAALREAAEKGIHIVASTGRIYPGIPKIIRELPFTRYFITCNGASVYDAAEQKAIFRDEIPAELAIRICEYMDTLPVVYYSYHDDGGWMSREQYKTADDYIHKSLHNMFRQVCVPVDDLKETIRQRGTGVQKLQMHFKDPAARLRELEVFPELFPETLMTTSVPTNIEINSRGANKGSALRGLCEVLGIDIRDAVAFGDGINDLTMIRDAGTGVAMANADPAVKAAADMITDTNNNAGVAKTIRELI